MEKVNKDRFMSQKRSLTTGLFVASLGLAAGLAVFSAPVSAADCSPAVKDSAVKAHCTKGGQAALKKAMKDAVDAANAAGEKGPDGKKLECKTCHENSTDFKLNSSAEDLYGKHLKKYFK
jgi:hypothetical protein